MTTDHATRVRNVKRRNFSTLLVTLVVALLAVTSDLGAGEFATSQRVNIVLILADDLGYGDLGCYGATKIKTPNCDRLAREGLRFTDAHSPSAVCTPTRYALLTGEYPWRKAIGVIPGTAGLIIEPGRLTLPDLLKRAGYTTAVVGKWHLGLGTKPTDYNTEIKPGPLEIGFDYAWLLPATGDRVPCVWIENHRVVGLDPADPIKLDYSVRRGTPPSLVNGIPRIGGQTGGKAAIWKDEEIADVITAKSVAFLEQNKARPFFLYLATHDIHVPRVPHPRFRNTSEAGVRGDTIHSFDWTVGQILDALDRLQLASNTLVIVTSDNGGMLDRNGADTEHSGTIATNNGHRFNGPLRGTKVTLFEGGTRVPFLVRWPGQVRVGTSDALISHIDMMASLAALTGQRLPDTAGPDSHDILSALLGGSGGRDHLVVHGHAKFVALRQGAWKFIPEPDATKKGKRAGSAVQLYNLSDDISESNNLAAQHPEKVKEMEELLNQTRATGKSRL